MQGGGGCLDADGGGVSAGPSSPFLGVSAGLILLDCVLAMIGGGLNAFRVMHSVALCSRLHTACDLLTGYCLVAQFFCMRMHMSNQL